MITALNRTWDYLDTMDKNLLYQYADVLAGKTKKIVSMSRQNSSYAIRYADIEKRKRNSYYLIWFMQKYRIYSYVKNAYIYVDLDAELVFRESDIAIILEILYNRYNIIEQLECFARNTHNHRKKKCLQVLEEYKQMMAVLERPG